MQELWSVTVGTVKQKPVALDDDIVGVRGKAGIETVAVADGDVGEVAFLRTGETKESMRV